MLQAVQLPAGVAHLDTGLANVDGDYLSHDDIFLAGLSLVTKQEACLAIESLRLNSKTEMSPSGGNNERKSGRASLLKSGGLGGGGVCSAGSRR